MQRLLDWEIAQGQPIGATEAEIEAARDLYQQFKVYLSPAGAVAAFDLLVEMSEMQVPRDRDEHIDSHVFREMATELADIPLHTLKDACRAHRSASAFMPTVHDLRQIAGEKLEYVRLQRDKVKAVAERGDPSALKDPPRGKWTRELAAKIKAWKEACATPGGFTPEQTKAREAELLDDPEFEPDLQPEFTA